MQHSCSHSNAICNHSFKNRIELRTHEQPLVAKHIGYISRSISLLLILLWCIDTLGIVTWSTTLHHVLMHYVLLHDPPPFIKVNFIASNSFVMYWCIMYCYMIHHPSSRSISLLLILLWCIDTLGIVTWSTTLHHVLMHYVLLHDPPPFIMYWCIMYCYMTHHPSSCIHALCIVTWPTTLHHVLMHYVLLHDPPPFIMYWCIRYCYMIHHPSSCIDALCIVTWSTTLHQGQFHCF